MKALPKVHPEVRPLFERVLRENLDKYPTVRYRDIWHITYDAMRTEMVEQTRRLLKSFGMMSSDGESGALAYV